MYSEFIDVIVIIGLRIHINYLALACMLTRAETGRSIPKTLGVLVMIVLANTTPYLYQFSRVIFNAGRRFPPGCRVDDVHLCALCHQGSLSFT